MESAGKNAINATAQPETTTDDDTDDGDIDDEHNGSNSSKVIHACFIILHISSYKYTFRNIMLVDCILAIY